MGIKFFFSYFIFYYWNKILILNQIEEQANNGNGESNNTLGRMYEKGKYWVEEDLTRSVKYYKKAAHLVLS